MTSDSRRWLFSIFMRSVCACSLSLARLMVARRSRARRCSSCWSSTRRAASSCSSRSARALAFARRWAASVLGQRLDRALDSSLSRLRRSASLESACVSALTTNLPMNARRRMASSSEVLMTLPDMANRRVKQTGGMSQCKVTGVAVLAQLCTRSSWSRHRHFCCTIRPKETHNNATNVTHAAVLVLNAAATTARPARRFLIRSSHNFLLMMHDKRSINPVEAAWGCASARRNCRGQNCPQQRVGPMRSRLEPPVRPATAWRPCDAGRLLHGAAVSAVLFGLAGA